MVTKHKTKQRKSLLHGCDNAGTPIIQGRPFSAERVVELEETPEFEAGEMEPEIQRELDRILAGIPPVPQ